VRDFVTITLLLLTFLNLNSQESNKIDLQNVNVGAERLPTIFLFGKEYTSRERDELLKGILKSQFYREDLKISMNLEDFTSNRIFRFKHQGPIEIFIDGKKLKNQNYYNSDTRNIQAYQVRDNSRLVRMLLKIQNVYIDSSLNGILKKQILSKQIKLTENKINEILNKSDFKIDNDTIIVRTKREERELNKFYRLKFRQEKKYNQASLIEIKISTY
tara:strand:- start:446 stop:1093 length:648 start_codon:yes stop_codon:yes gene_type:complete